MDTAISWAELRKMTVIERSPESKRPRHLRRLHRLCCSMRKWWFLAAGYFRAGRIETALHARALPERMIFHDGYFETSLLFKPGSWPIWADAHSLRAEMQPELCLLRKGRGRRFAAAPGKNRADRSAGTGSSVRCGASCGASWYCGAWDCRSWRASVQSGNFLRAGDFAKRVSVISPVCGNKRLLFAGKCRSFACIGRENGHCHRQHPASGSASG